MRRRSKLDEIQRRVEEMCADYRASPVPSIRLSEIQNNRLACKVCGKILKSQHGVKVHAAKAHGDV